jgi:hypothetical protein
LRLNPTQPTPAYVCYAPIVLKNPTLIEVRSRAGFEIALSAFVFGEVPG